ncbi:hypothetical protein [Streptomyces sp. NPDC059909]|uniref:hypothetical protein n=1 Tax=Streptomyces sp. NPDC059909 TaxID=3346998 RepID=UPI003656D8E9
MGHSSLSGHDLPAGVLLLAFAVSGGAAWLAGTRRRGTFCIGTGLLTVQGALHLLFAGSDAHTTSLPHSAHAGGAAPTVGTDPMAAEAMASATTVYGAGPADSAGMLAAHFVGAAVCALWLAHGEVAFFRLARTVGTLAFAPLRLLLAVVRVPELPHAVRPRPRTRRLHGVVLAHALSRRGPPGRPFTRATAPGALV